MTDTSKVIDSAEFSLENLGYTFPSYSVPSGHDQDSFLRERSFESAKARYPRGLNEAVRSKLNHELAIIYRLGFSGYFLAI